MRNKKLVKIVSLATLSTVIMSVNPMQASAAWKQNNIGWWYTEGSSWATGWRSINGSWYYFDNSGYMKTGWIKDNGTWYYLTNSGAMKTGWLLDNGSWYYMNSSGAMQTGWIKDNGKWYYLESNGAMLTGELEYKGDKYYLNRDGSMQIGLTEVEIFGQPVYYYDENGVMKTGWITIDGKKYYFYEDGRTAEGIRNIDGKLYKFYNYGGIDTTTRGWTSCLGPIEMPIVDQPHGYIKEDGTVACGWEKIKGKDYYFDENGAVALGVKEIGANKDSYYFDCLNYNAVENLDCYGISTGEKGKVKELRTDLAKKDILTNDSKNISKLEDKYGSLKLELSKVTSMQIALGDDKCDGYDEINEEGKRGHSIKKDNQSVFWFQAKANVNGKERVVQEYCVSIQDGTIYAYTIEDKNYIYVMKDNEKVKTYEGYYLD